MFASDRARSPASDKGSGEDQGMNRPLTFGLALTLMTFAASATAAEPGVTDERSLPLLDRQAPVLRVPPAPRPPGPGSGSGFGRLGGLMAVRVRVTGSVRSPA